MSLRLRMVYISMIILGIITFFTTQLAYSATYKMPAPGDDIVGQLYVIEASSGDNLERIGERYGISQHEMQEANPNLHRRYLRSGDRVLIPAAYVLPPYREGIVINLPELRLYYFTPDGKKVHTYPVGLGRNGWRTPLTKTKVVNKKENPEWNVPKTIQQFVYEQTGRFLPDVIHPDDPENPLGEHAMYLGHRGYLIHGTNQEWTVGKFISSGCVRLYNADVAELFYKVPIGTPVRIIHHSVKAGWHNGQLFLEAQTPMNLDDRHSRLYVSTPDVALQYAVDRKQARVDWDRVYSVNQNQQGVPRLVGYHGNEHAMLETRQEVENR